MKDETSRAFFCFTQDAQQKDPTANICPCWGFEPKTPTTLFAVLFGCKRTIV